MFGGPGGGEHTAPDAPEDGTRGMTDANAVDVNVRSDQIVRLLSLRMLIKHSRIHANQAPVDAKAISPLRHRFGVVDLPPIIGGQSDQLYDAIKAAAEFVIRIGQVNLATQVFENRFRNALQTSQLR
jgi:hypothetical protein